MNKLRENIEKVKEKMLESASRAKRKIEDITLVVVTKTVSAAIIENCVSLGIKNIGENKVQDAKEKFDMISDLYDVKWHLIGHLQKNKVKSALSIFDFFHSIDSFELAEEIDKRASKKIPILLQANVSGEETKHGFSSEKLEREIEKIMSLPNIEIRGLMTMAPLTEDAQICRKCFSELRELKEKLNSKYSDKLNMEHLSMGMSQDFEIAIEEGATMIRVGSSIFEGISN